MPPKPTPFPWPPNPTDLAAPAEKLSPGAIHLLTDAADDLETDVSLDEPDPTDSEQQSPPRRGVARFIDVFETQLLGRTAQPWSLRAANWKRDEIGDYCPRCGITCRPFELDTLTDPATCPRCRDKRPAWGRFIRIGAYEGLLARAIRELKFTRFRALGEPLGAELGHAIAEELEARDIRPHTARIVPMPMSPWRRLARGIDHALVLARSASRASHVPLARLLVRRHRPSQITLPVSERRGNVAGAFTCRSAVSKCTGISLLILLDDVRTTGATMTEASRTLRQGLAEGHTGPNGSKTEIWAATVGVAPLVRREERA
ncbi:MAG: hypothetical protein U0570_00015 [Phycisphaerales bacterium]